MTLKSTPVEQLRNSGLFLLVALAGCQGGDQINAPTPDNDASNIQASVETSREQPIDVIFVCQHGYAKSLVATRHFERVAAGRGIPVRVIARGVTPNESVPATLAAALGNDGFEVRSYRPQGINTDELAEAEYVVSFGNEVPESPGASRMDWSDVSALSEDYSKARDEIVAHLSELLDEIEARRAQSE